MIKHGKEIKKGNIVKFLESVIDKYKEIEYCDLEIESIKYMLKKDEYSNYYFVIKENKIVDIIFYDLEYGIKILYPNFILDYEKKEIIEDIRKYFKNEKVLLYFNNYNIDIEKLNLHESILTSTIDIEHEYHIGYGAYFALKEEDIYILRDAIESKYFPNVNLKMNKNDISFELIDGKEQNINIYLVENNIFWKNKNNQHTIVGFHYLQNDFFDGNKLLLAKYNGTIIGCIKYGIYYGENYSSHYGLNYIDTKFGYRNKGVAKILINHLATILEEKPLILSKESDMGKLCNMEKHFKNSNFKVKVNTYK